MSKSEAGAAPAQRKALGLRTLISNPGLYFLTLFKGKFVGADAMGNQYFERPGKLRARRWVVYAGAPEASVIGPEWHAWLHHLTDAPLADTGAKPWWRPHQANLTGTPDSYRPAGHDYMGGNRARASADYEAWSPDQS
ncbi:MAG TPA: NADH-ubiquinone oxidoreductase subunit NDUFA12 family protein [Acidocella sp.]|jgi:NADH:ubiquinone oxidoreductase subunit|nr:NADH-ubiquinone oxidoreductase subunit NDUFA12 family protein [Acidocella sp.]